jgi:dTDP-4-amino-4,6-dideoxygalactose transaminase
MPGLNSFSLKRKRILSLSEWRIPLSDLDYDTGEEEAVLRVLRSKWLTMGAEVEAFEQEFANLIGTKYAVAVASGTAALHLAYLALGIGLGDEVIQPAINFVASANMTLAVGAIPVFGDIISLEEPTIKPEDISRLITPKTKAVVVMHYGGYLSRMDEILDICTKHSIPLVEDACHAVGSQYRNSRLKPPHGKMAGNLGEIACFSFFSNKNIAIGEGGMITTNRVDLAQRIRLLRSHGMTTLTWDRHRGHSYSYDVVAQGFNYRLDEIHAALGRMQLRKLQKNNERRGQLVSAYRYGLSGFPGWIFPFADYCGDSSYHLAALVAPDEERRSKLIRFLKKAKIQTSLHYPFLPQFEAFKWSQCNGHLTRSLAYSQRALTLPLFPGMTISDVEGICAIIHEFVQAAN